MFGKLIGGGFPIGAVGGAEELMRSLDFDYIKVWHSGTFNANPISMAAGDIAVRELTDRRIKNMEALGAKLRDESGTFRRGASQARAAGKRVGRG